MADDDVIVKVNEVTIAEAEVFETDTKMTFAEGLSLVLTNRISAPAAKAFLRLARRRPGGDALPTPTNYVDLLNLFGPEGCIVIDFGDPKDEAPS